MEDSPERSIDNTLIYSCYLGQRTAVGPAFIDEFLRLHCMTVKDDCGKLQSLCFGFVSFFYRERKERCEPSRQATRLAASPAQKKYEVAGRRRNRLRRAYAGVNSEPFPYHYGHPLISQDVMSLGTWAKRLWLLGDRGMAEWQSRCC